MSRRDGQSLHQLALAMLKKLGDTTCDFQMPQAFVSHMSAFRPGGACEADVELGHLLGIDDSNARTPEGPPDGRMQSGNNCKLALSSLRSLLSLCYLTMQPFLLLARASVLQQLPRSPLMGSSRNIGGDFDHLQQIVRDIVAVILFLLLQRSYNDILSLLRSGVAGGASEEVPQAIQVVEFRIHHIYMDDGLDPNWLRTYGSTKEVVMKLARELVI